MPASPSRRTRQTHRESKALARRLLAESIDKQGISRGQLTVHADRGASMTSKPVARLLLELGVEKTHSRPYTSNDNPFSEAHFKTLKYQPTFPQRFTSFEEARAFCGEFFSWYNSQHCHTNLALLTPEDVHYGRAEKILEKRASVLRKAFEADPRRFKGRCPKPGKLPKAVWINPPVNPSRRPPLSRAVAISSSGVLELACPRRVSPSRRPHLGSPAP